MFLNAAHQQPNAHLRIAAAILITICTPPSSLAAATFDEVKHESDTLILQRLRTDATVRLGTSATGRSRIASLYAPEMFDESPNARVMVEAAK